MSRLRLLFLFFCAALALPAADVRFPLSIGENHRHFTDAKGRAFLVTADTAWMLLYRLSPKEQSFYFRNRAQLGFNTVLVQLLSYRPDVKTRSGELPLLEADRLDRLNPRFLDEAEAAVASAAKHGLLVAIAPAWLSCCQGGWRETMLHNGPDVCRRFGEYVGGRFARFKNVMWILGGDRDPGQYAEVVTAMADGIRAAAPGQLMTAHAGSPRAASEVYPSASWLDVDSTYTYSPEVTSAGRPQFHVYAASAANYRAQPTRPFLLLESSYEGERESTPQIVRRQAWWSILSGSAGQAFGNRPIYQFAEGWEQALNGQGSKDMGRISRFFAQIPWQTLTPDLEHRVLIEGFGTFDSASAKDKKYSKGYDYVTAAASEDRRWLVAYLPSRRRVTIRVSDTTARAMWFEPSSGQTYPAGKLKTGEAELEPPDVKRGSGDDWVLLVKPR